GDPVLLGHARLYEPDYNNWGPRVSVAWDVTGKGRTVLRAGYGGFYDALSQDMFLGHLPWNSVFDPGSAYSGYSFDPNAVFTSDWRQVLKGTDLVNAPLDPTQAVYEGSSPMADRFGVDQHMRTPYMQNFNLNLQQQIGSRLVFQIGYVGSNGHKLFRFRD